MDGNGVQYVSRAAGAQYDYGQDGYAEKTGWVASNDGLLAEMRADGSLKIVFSTAPGETDMQGLAKVYDSNSDHVFSIADKDFASFGVWQDRDGDGVFDNGEFVSLKDAGITAINLITDGQAYSAADGDVKIFGSSTYVKADGSTALVQDVGFVTDNPLPAAPANVRAAPLPPEAQGQDDSSGNGQHDQPAHGAPHDMDMSMVMPVTDHGVDAIDIQWNAHGDGHEGWTGEVLSVDRMDAPDAHGAPGGWTLFVDQGDGLAPYHPSPAEHLANQVLLENAAMVKIDMVSASGDHQQYVAEDVSKIVWGH